MTWGNQGGGPWTQGSNPLEGVLNSLKQRLGGGVPGLSIIVVIVAALWLASGVYTVAPDEVGVERRFGKYTRITQPGLQYHFPFPVESVVKPKVTRVNRVEIGFRTIRVGPPSDYRPVPKESLMLTGDENIISIWFVVQWRIKDAAQYLFEVAYLEGVVKNAAEAAMRIVMGKNLIDEALTSGKFKIQEDTMILMQEILDKYNAGVKVEAVQLQDVHPPEQVMQAFKDVASAKEDRSRAEREAEGYRNDIIPTSRGTAQKMINEAEAYKQSKILRAQGDAERFLKLVKEYEKAKDITRKRLYLEAMETILPQARKIILGQGVGQGVLPLLPLQAGTMTGLEGVGGASTGTAGK